MIQNNSFDLPPYYSEFLPPWQPLRFGDEFLSNFDGGSATLQGELGPQINQQIAITGPVRFPTAQMSDAGKTFNPDVITPATGPTQGEIALVQKNNRFADWSKKAGIGILGIVLIAIGVIYLGLTVYAKSTDSGSIAEALAKTP